MPASSRPRRRRLQQPARREIAAGGAVNSGGPVEGLGEGARGKADHHQVLNIDAARGMGAATEDLDLRQGQQRGVRRKVVPERRAVRGGRRMQRRHRDRDRCVAAQAALIGCAIGAQKQRGRHAAWSAASAPASDRAMRPLTFATVPRRRIHRHRGDRPPRPIP